MQPLADQSPLELLRPMADQLQQQSDEYLRTGDQKLNERRRKLAEALTAQVKKIDRRYGVSLGWGGGNSTPTPCSDGKLIYVWRGETGVLACYEPDGHCRWRRFHHTGDDAEHGFNASPIINGDVIGIIGGGRVFGFDRADGHLRWTQRYPHPCYASLVAARVGGEAIFITPVGMILRAVDGKVLQKAFGQFDGECAFARPGRKPLSPRRPRRLLQRGVAAITAGRQHSRADRWPAFSRGGPG